MAWHHRGATYIHFTKQWPPPLHNFDFRTSQNSISNILSSTGNPSSESLLHLCRWFLSPAPGPPQGSIQKQKNKNVFLLLSLAVRQFVPICPQAHLALWLSWKLLPITAVLTNLLYGNSWPLFLKGMEKPGDLLPAGYFPYKLLHLHKLSWNKLFPGFTNSILQIVEPGRCSQDPLATCEPIT